MPRPCLLLMGMLSKHPQKSSVMKRFGNNHGTKTFTQNEIKHAVALYWTPEFSRAWIAWQFRNFERNPENIMRSIRKLAYNPYYRNKWQHLGQRNLQFIGLNEVQAYYDRHPPIQRMLPSWALTVINDLIKRGETQMSIAKRFGLSFSTVNRAIKNRTIFDAATAFQKAGNPNMANHGPKDIIIPHAVKVHNKKISKYKKKWYRKRKKSCESGSGVETQTN